MSTLTEMKQTARANQYGNHAASTRTSTKKQTTKKCTENESNLTKRNKHGTINSKYNQ